MLILNIYTYLMLFIINDILSIVIVPTNPSNATIVLGRMGESLPVHATVVPLTVLKVIRIMLNY
jgi:hypothetical protein